MSTSTSVAQLGEAAKSLRLLKKKTVKWFFVCCYFHVTGKSNNILIIHVNENRRDSNN